MKKFISFILLGGFVALSAAHFCDQQNHAETQKALQNSELVAKANQVSE